MSNIVRLLCVSLMVLSACGGQASGFSGGSQKAEASQQAELQPAGWVTDAASVLTDAEEEGIAQQLRQLERETGRQMVVVTIPTLEGQSIEEYSLRLFNRWGVGRSEQNDGIGVLLAPNERMVRIEVGSGLEPVVTNDFAATVIRADMIPRFTEGDYSGGLSAGVSKLIEQLSIP